MTNCLVLGGAKCVFDDVERALRLGEFDGLITVNDVTTVWKGNITAAVSLHAEKWPIWLKQRNLKGLPAPERVYAHEVRGRITPLQFELITHYAKHLYPNQKDSGSSGLFGVKVALDELCFDKVVCAGIPMTPENRHYFDNRPWGGAPNHRRGWLQASGLLVDRVRSMSGWTEELLGKPTISWLKEIKDDG